MLIAYGDFVVHILRFVLRFYDPERLAAVAERWDWEDDAVTA